MSHPAVCCSVFSSDLILSAEQKTSNYLRLCQYLFGNNAWQMSLVTTVATEIYELDIKNNLKISKNYLKKETHVSIYLLYGPCGFLEFAKLYYQELVEQPLRNTRGTSGYVNVTERDFLFYWFVEAKDVRDAPVILWSNGGPGCTSMEGASTEIGPLLLKGVKTGNGYSGLNFQRLRSFVKLHETSIPGFHGV